MRERFDQLRAMGIRTVMITGDNPLTAAAIAREAGVDDFLAQAKPEDKLALIRAEQAKGKLVAMTGDGTNDAPALAQADVGLAMNAGTQAAKEAGNMVDLDSNPTKLIEVVEIGKQLLITRGALTTFSVANDVAKYFAIIPAMFAGAFPQFSSAEHHGAEDAGVGDSVGRDLQRADHHRARAAGPARRALSSAGRVGAAALESAGLRRGRHHRAVYRHQADRLDHYAYRLGMIDGRHCQIRMQRTQHDGSQFVRAVRSLHDGRRATRWRTAIPAFILAFAVSCVLASVYGFLQGAWPFGLVEAIWSVIAVRRWRTHNTCRRSVGADSMRHI